MKTVWLIFRRELAASFLSPAAWVVISAFFAISCLLILVGSFGSKAVDFGSSMGNLAIVVFLVCPVITMRLFPEERRQGTIELLFTSPVGPMRIVLGKYLAALAIFVVALILTLLIPCYLGFETELRWAPILLSYGGLALLGAAVLGIGTVASAFTSSQVAAGVLGTIISLALFLLSWLAGQAEGSARTVLSELSLLTHYDTFLRGIFDVKDLAYFSCWVFASLFVSARVLDSHRWRG